MRVVMPEGPNTTNLHCDADYHHPPAEVGIIIKTSNNSHLFNIRSTGGSRSHEYLVPTPCSSKAVLVLETLSLSHWSMGRFCDCNDKKSSSRYQNCSGQMFNIKHYIIRAFLQVLRFYGNLCQHYSVPNTSPTR